MREAVREYEGSRKDAKTQRKPEHTMRGVMSIAS